MIQSSVRHYLRLLRPLSSTKNVAVAMVAYYFCDNNNQFVRLGLIVIALSAVSSAMYALNSFYDLRLDSKNENKKTYSDAASFLGSGKIFRIIAFFLIVGLVIGFWMNILSGICLIGFFITAYIYSSPYFRFKEKIFLDVLFGAVLTFGLRFLACWFALGSGPVPLAALIALICGKSAGYLFYKMLDRDSLKANSIHNTATLFSATILLCVIIFFLIATFSAIIIMAVNPVGRLNWIGNVPFSFIYALPLSIPPLVIVFLQAFHFIHWKQSLLRTIGFFYLFVVSLFIWKFF